MALKTKSTSNQGLFQDYRAIKWKLKSYLESAQKNTANGYKVQKSFEITVKNILIDNPYNLAQVFNTYYVDFLAFKLVFTCNFNLRVWPTFNLINVSTKSFRYRDIKGMDTIMFKDASASIIVYSTKIISTCLIKNITFLTKYISQSVEIVSCFFYSVTNNRTISILPSVSPSTE